MFKFRKKKKPEKDSRPQVLDEAYETGLTARKKELQKQLDQCNDNVSKEAAEAGFWGMVGAMGIALDFAVLGGIGTGLAASSGFLWNRYNSRRKRAEKELKQVELELKEYEELKQRLSPPAPEKKALETASVKDGFKAAAQPETEVDLLKKKLSELEKKVDELQNPRPTRLDKTVPKKPFDKP